MAETKNGAVVRKEFGYEHIERRHADRFDTYCREYLNPFLNFHRPCLFATELADPKKPGRIKRVYRPCDAMTPLDKLASLPEAASCLRPGVTLLELYQLAHALTDVQAAEELNEARQALFRRTLTRTGLRRGHRSGQTRSAAAGLWTCGRCAQQRATTRTGTTRGQRGYTLPTGTHLRPHAHSPLPRLKKPKKPSPIYWPVLQPIDSLRVVDLRALQAHT